MGESRQHVKVMQGNEACAEGAILAGCRFFAGYPITPATEVAEVMAKRMPEESGVFIQMEDELGSINALIGAAWGGLKTMTATSGPGFTLVQEGIGYACLTQTPCVIVNVMRGGPSTGQPTLPAQQDVYQARYGSHGDYELIVLAPSSAQEALDMTIHAFNLSERYLTPVIILSDEVVGHTRERVVIPEHVEVWDRVAPPRGHDYKPFAPVAENRHVPYRANFGEGRRILVDGQLHDAMGTRVGHLHAPSAACVRHMQEKITHNLPDILDMKTEFLDDATCVVLAYGSTARAAQRAVRDAREAGLKAGFIRLRTLFPFPDAFLQGLAGHVDSFIVPEMNSGKISRELQAAICRPVVSLPKLGGEMPTPAEILDAIRGEMQ